MIELALMLGFGIPVTYLVATLYVLRATYRSMYKRSKTGPWDDWEIILGFMALFWPVLAPVYFPWVTFQKRNKGVNFFEWFFKRNLPETDRDKEVRHLREKQEMKYRIRELERELGIGV